MRHLKEQIESTKSSFQKEKRSLERQLEREVEEREIDEKKTKAKFQEM